MESTYKTLLEEYRQFASDHGKYTREGDSVKGNKAYDQLQVTLAHLVDAGDDGQLVMLYEDEDTHVQLWAVNPSSESSRADNRQQSTEKRGQRS